MNYFRTTPSIQALLTWVSALLLCGCGTLVSPSGLGVTQMPGPPPEVFETTAVASYKPVPVPGTQRRAAQFEAEEKARRQVLEYVGSLAAGPGGRETVNQVMNRDPQLRAKVLEFVRTSCLADWLVDPCAGSVQVIVRADLTRLEAILAAYGCHPTSLR